MIPVPLRNETSKEILMESSLQFKGHLFICTRCQYRKSPEIEPIEGQASELRRQVKELAAKDFPKDQVRVNASGCLGQCERGISAVLYPQGKWKLENNPNSPQELYDWLKEQVST